MKKLDFMAALNSLSDGTIAEAADARENNPQKRNIRPRLKYGAIAACAALVILAAAGIARNVHIERSDPDAGVTDSSVSDNGGAAAPVADDGLMLLKLPEINYFGGGSRGVFARDISEIAVTGLDEDDDLPGELSVYKNGSRWLPVSWGAVPETADVEGMTAVLKEYAALWGLDADSLEIKGENSFTESDIENYEKETDSPAPEGMKFPQTLEASQNGITVRAGRNEVYVFLDDGDTAPDYDGSDPDSVYAAAEYFMSAYADKINFDDPEIILTDGTRDVYGKREYGAKLCSRGKTPAEEIRSREFESVTLGIDGEGRLSSISYGLGETESPVGVYPLITPEEAVEEYSRGNYIGAGENDVIYPENVLETELCYYFSDTAEYILPCYRLWVYDPDSEIERQMDMKCYDCYYVPAVEPRFLQSESSTAEAKPLKPFSASEIPSYTNLGYYDGVVRDFKPATVADETLEEIFADSYENSFLGSFYKVRVNGVVAEDDIVWLNGYDVLSGDGSAMFYSATILYDYFAEKPMNKNIIFRMTGSAQMQDSGSPPFTVSDVVALLLYRDSEYSDFNRAFKCYAFVYDVENIDGAEYLLARGQSVPELENGLTDYLTDETASVVTSTTINPAVYHGAYDPAELSEKLKGIIDGAEKLPLEELSENYYGPGALAHGGEGPESAKEAEPIEFENEPQYSAAEISEPIAVTGEPQSLSELLKAWQDMGKTVRGVEYQITNVYTYEEAVNLYGEFNPRRTLYRAHAFYDALNNCPLDYYFDVAGWGSAESQEEGWPPYAEGDRLLSFFSDAGDGYEIAESGLEFMLFTSDCSIAGHGGRVTVDDVKLAYHVGGEQFRFESSAYPNLDLGLSEGEKRVITTTANNPIVFTQKSTLVSLCGYLRNAFYN